jgi:hypothetical protein
MACLSIVVCQLDTPLIKVFFLKKKKENCKFNNPNPKNMYPTIQILQSKFEILYQNTIHQYIPYNPSTQFCIKTQSINTYPKTYNKQNIQLIFVLDWYQKVITKVTQYQSWHTRKHPKTVTGKSTAPDKRRRDIMGFVK